MTPGEHARLIDHMATLPGGDHEFVVQREIEAQDRDGLGAGISAEAMRTLDQQMITWVGTRMLRFEKERGVMPQSVRVVVSVEMEV